MSGKLETTDETSVKKRGRGGKYNFPNAVEPEDKDVVHAVLSSCLHWYKRGEDKCNTDEEVRERTIEYFEYCISHSERPTVESYALALGHNRQVLNRWEHGEGASDAKRDIIKQAKEFLAAYDAGMVTTGKMNPVPYIFRAKNYYGMRDQQDVVIEPKNPLGAELTAEEIAERYEALPEE